MSADNNTTKDDKNPIKGSGHNDHTLEGFSCVDFTLLNSLTSPLKLSELAKKIGRDKSNTRRSLIKLIKRGVVIKEDVLYFMSKKGRDLLKMGSGLTLYGSKNMTTPIEGRYGERVRLHDVSFTLRFWVVPVGWDRLRGTVFGLEGGVGGGDIGSFVSGYSNNRGFRGGGFQTLHMGEYTVVCYARSVRVFVPEVVRVDPGEAVAEAWRSLLEVIPKLERWLKIPEQSLYSRGRLNVKISTSHFALFKSAFAEYMIKDKHETRFLVRDKEGVPRLLVDHSGAFETESINPHHGLSDIEIEREFHRQIIEGEGPLPRETKAALDMIGAQISDVNDGLGRWQTEALPILHEYSARMQDHIALTAEVAAAAASLNQALNRLDKLVGLLLYPWRVFQRWRGRGV